MAGISWGAGADEADGFLLGFFAGMAVVFLRLANTAGLDQ